MQAVEAVGALQAQYWPAPPVALWSRVAGFAPEPYYAALDARRARHRHALRATLHLVSAREHPAYAAVAAKRRATTGAAPTPSRARRSRPC